VLAASSVVTCMPCRRKVRLLSAMIIHLENIGDTTLLTP
jgi:hypothetical protein